MTWHLAFCRGGAEAAINWHLRHLGYETLFLHYIRTVKHARREHQVIRPYFPQYLFLSVPADRGLYQAANLPGVIEILRSNGRPTEIDQAIIDQLRERAGQEGLIQTIESQDPERERLAAGQVCRIMQGPLTGYTAAVQIDKGLEIIVEIELFGRVIRVSMMPESLSPVWRSVAKTETGRSSLVRCERPPALSLAQSNTADPA